MGLWYSDLKPQLDITMPDTVVDMIRQQDAEVHSRELTEAILTTVDSEEVKQSWDGLGTTAPSDVQENSELVTETPEDILVEDDDPENDELDFSFDNTSETRQRVNAFRIRTGNYTRNIGFEDHQDGAYAQVYYENGQPFAIEIGDQQGSVVISSSVLGQITVFAQMCSYGGGSQLSTHEANQLRNQGGRF